MVTHALAYDSYRAVIVKLTHIESNDHIYAIDFNETLLSKLDTKSVVFSSSIYVIQVLRASTPILKHLEDKCRQDLENIVHQEFLLASTLQDFHVKASEADPASTAFTPSHFSATPGYSPKHDTSFQSPRSAVGGVGDAAEVSFDQGVGASGTLSLSQRYQLMRQTVARHPDSLLFLDSSDGITGRY